VCGCVRVRELSAGKVGSLLRISGQVVRTHPVHPELTLGMFICLECQASIPDVEQQFKFTQPTSCKNPMCQNRRRFMLDITKSQFVDFQKVRIQETQQEMPRGSVPRRSGLGGTGEPRDWSTRVLGPRDRSTRVVGPRDWSFREVGPRDWSTRVVGFRDRSTRVVGPRDWSTR